MSFAILARLMESRLASSSPSGLEDHKFGHHSNSFFYYSLRLLVYHIWNNYPPMFYLKPRYLFCQLQAKIQEFTTTKSFLMLSSWFMYGAFKKCYSFSWGSMCSKMKMPLCSGHRVRQRCASKFNQSHLFKGTSGLKRKCIQLLTLCNDKLIHCLHQW